MLTAAVRDLHRAYPGRFLTDVRTRHPELWLHNPYLSSLAADASVQEIECLYPLIERSNFVPCHFLEGMIQFLNQQLNVRVELTEFCGDIHLSMEEQSQPSPAFELGAWDGPYWIIVAGGKSDFTIKWWQTARFQQVVDHFRGTIKFVQVGAAGDFHPELSGVIDLRARTDLRQLVRLVYGSDGVLCPVTSLMHLAAAVPNRLPHRLRPCVVIAGGREPPHWEAYPGHQFLHTIGMLACCRTGGCWRARTKPLRDGSQLNRPERLCLDVADGLPRCMHLITAADVIRKVELYLESQIHFDRLIALEERRLGLQASLSDYVGHTRRHTPTRQPLRHRRDDRDFILDYYRHASPALKRPLDRDLSEHALTNSPLGLGDTLLLTQLPWAAVRQNQRRYIASESPHFLPLVRLNPFYEPAGNRARVAADLLQRRYALGNGHFIQRLQRAFRLEPDLLPRPFLEVPRRPTSSRVVFHFEAKSPHAAWQRAFAHPRARQLYPESQRIIQQFVDRHPEMSFCQIGKGPVNLLNVQDCSGLALEETIQVIGGCDLFIGIVSGPMHLATALGLECVVILNFPRAADIILPALKDINLIESEWLYPQNVHLHQENEGPLVKRLTLASLEDAVQGELYPYWSQEYLELIHEKL